MAIFKWINEYSKYFLVLIFNRVNTNSCNHINKSSLCPSIRAKEFEEQKSQEPLLMEKQKHIPSCISLIIAVATTHINYNFSLK